MRDHEGSATADGVARRDRQGRLRHVEPSTVRIHRRRLGAYVVCVALSRDPSQRLAPDHGHRPTARRRSSAIPRGLLALSLLDLEPFFYATWPESSTATLCLVMWNAPMVDDLSQSSPLSAIAVGVCGLCRPCADIEVGSGIEPAAVKNAVGVAVGSGVGGAAASSCAV